MRRPGYRKFAPLLFFTVMTCFVRGKVSFAEQTVSPGAATYTVSNEMQSLGEIALYLYGHTYMYRKIAEWNGLQAPFRIHPGTVLKLQLMPRISHEEGFREVLAMWRKRFGVDANAEPDCQNLTANDCLRTGLNYYDSGRYEEALVCFQRGRGQDESFVENWLYELRTLALLGMKTEREELKSRFIKKFPDTHRLPPFAERKRARRP